MAIIKYTFIFIVSALETQETRLLLRMLYPSFFFRFFVFLSPYSSYSSS